MYILKTAVGGAIEVKLGGDDMGKNEKDLLSCDNRSPVVGVDGFEPPTLCL